MPLAEAEAIVARFEERVNAAQVAAAPTRDMVRQALRRQGTGHSPVRLKRVSVDVILRHGDALSDLFCEHPDDVVSMTPYDFSIGHQPQGNGQRINVVDVMTREADWVDEWGTRWGHAAGGVGATPISCPLTDWSQLDDYLEHQMPDPRSPGRLDPALPLLEAHGDTRYCIGVVHLVLFERLQALRGMEELLVDFHTHEAEVRRLLDALSAYLQEIIRYWGELGAHAVFLTDDWGTQSGLMISPAMWRGLFREYYRAAFDEAHGCGMDVIFHSCGSVTSIVGELIDIGLDVLDPVQPGAMDIDEVAREFGGHVSFSGGIDVQRLHGSTPGEVRDEVRRTIDVLGRAFGDGLIVGPSNALTPEIPLGNLQALFAACHER